MKEDHCVIPGARIGGPYKGHSCPRLTSSLPPSQRRTLQSTKEFPAHWPRIGGMDFGWDHPFAAVEIAWDRGSDVVYVSRTHRLREASPPLHAATLRAWGKELPWAWPRD